MNKTYRTDIDGLRAVAVVSVILFHLGFLPNGYLGVDIFFVISGYLITGIAFNDVVENKFSVLKFYERRIRRIIPLVLFTSFVAFVLGILFMLPDDLENLCQSIVASNFSANNLLMYITSSDYWAVKNDYKPLMHTWSLGIEEQFYLLFPFIFVLLKGKRIKFILPLLLLLTVLSFLYFYKAENEAQKFYFLQYRFFELSIGGICAIIGAEKLYAKSKYLLLVFILSLLFIICFDTIRSNDIKVVLITIISAGILVVGALHFQNFTLYRKLLSNKIITGIGKISFSLYMWHQIVFAFARYAYLQEITGFYAVVLSIVVLLLSLLSYRFIENIFRDRLYIKTRPLLIIVSFSFVLITSMSFYVYAVGGIIRDVPELSIKKTALPKKMNFFSGESNINIQYNEEVRKLNKPFSSDDKTKILVYGDSYARDFVNVLLASSFSKKIELCYYDKDYQKTHDESVHKFKDADLIFFATNSTFTKEEFNELKLEYGIDSNKIWIVGTKDFGNSNGIYYNRRNKQDNCNKYRTSMKKGVLEINNKLKSEWGAKYIDLISLVINADNQILVFTPDCKFISQDTLHFTKSGAQFFAILLEQKLMEILSLNKA